MERIIQISHVTQGFLTLSEPDKVRVPVNSTTKHARRRTGLWGLRDPKTGHPRVFVEQNETGAYTALLAGEH